MNASVLLAVLAKNPVVELNEAEADKLGEAIDRVAAFYQVPLLSEEARAWMYLGMVGFEVIGTRVIATVAERKRKPATVTPIKHTPQQTHPNANQQSTEAYTDGFIVDGQKIINGQG